ncbi:MULTISPECIES: hypothetical protein [Sorangium]|uniref:Uncharacterized protein n=1 Tax=Sorangium cellulosum TaxID=56 RepID=A0A4P2QSW3_SORCE|nr:MULTISPECIES: hypothetical protein [Sorangium]AUX33146.1 uncharacterized protein SOCE836_053000 [Sorangium cellulosum]AUX33203.1 uncharacterized protein SOCE836_053570 [Sorangium cellulosum]WCQ92522.1 hypothetical protein NQZ70_05263 [Sorangium sp. Soce836]
MSCSTAIPKYCTRQGARDPVALRIVIAASDAVPDLTLVTAVELSALDRRASPATPETWTTTILERVEDELVVEHRYQEADTATPRTWRITPWMTISGAANPVAAATFDLQVMARP